MTKRLTDAWTTSGTSAMPRLPEDRVREIEAACVAYDYAPREVVFHQGTAANGLYFICSGLVKVYQSNRIEREFILTIARAPSVLGEIGVDDGQRFSASAQALTPAQICFFSREQLSRLLERHPEAGLLVGAALSSSLSDARHKAAKIALMKADARLADLLLTLASTLPSNGETEAGTLTIGYPFSRKELADMVGVTSETVIRLLGDFVERGAIRTRGASITITDQAHLLRLAQRGNPTM